MNLNPVNLKAIFAVGLIVACTFFHAAFAQSGLPDSTFGTAGLVTTTFNSAITHFGAAQQTDGKIVVLGGYYWDEITSMDPLEDIKLGRYNTNGTPDSSFGTNGLVIASVTAQKDLAKAVVIQQDGKIVVGVDAVLSGTFRNRGIGLMRFNSNGAIDSTYGTNGYTQAVFDTFGGEILAAIIQPDQKIVVLGNYGYADSALLARFNTNGTLDATFGSGGKITYPVQAIDIALQADGKLIVYQNGSNNSTLTDSRIFRLLSNGQLDNTYGTGGIATITFNDGLFERRVRHITIDAQGRIVLAGYYQKPFNSTRLSFAGRVDASGAMDLSFGNMGFAVYDLSGDSSGRVHAVVVQADGKIVVGGVAAGKFLVARMDSSGNLDNSYGTAGKTITQVGAGANSESGVDAMLLQADGKVVAVGMETQTPNLAWAVVRYTADSVTIGIGSPTTGSLSLNAYPNPATDVVTIEFDVPTQQQVEITLFDIWGKAYSHYQTTVQATGKTQHQLDLAELAAGCYLVRITNAGGSLNRTVRVQKVR